MARVEPYEPGAWKFYCDCGGEANTSSRPIGCTRIVTDSEINFRCETPIREAKEKPCTLVHHLPPLIKAYEKRKKQEDAKRFLASLEKKRQEALETLGLADPNPTATGVSAAIDLKREET